MHVYISRARTYPELFINHNKNLNPILTQIKVDPRKYLTSLDACRFFDDVAKYLQFFEPGSNFCPTSFCLFLIVHVVNFVV
jgi:hypothetical protein